MICTALRLSVEAPMNSLHSSSLYVIFRAFIKATTSVRTTKSPCLMKKAFNVDCLVQYIGNWTPSWNICHCWWCEVYNFDLDFGKFKSLMRFFRSRWWCYVRLWGSADSLLGTMSVSCDAVGSAMFSSVPTRYRIHFAIHIDGVWEIWRIWHMYVFEHKSSGG